MKNFAMLRESLSKALGIELSPWTIMEIRNKNVSCIRDLLYKMYIAIQEFSLRKSFTMRIRG